MSSTVEAQDSESTEVAFGGLAMVHLRVGDADRAMQFFGALFGWQAERVPFDGHVSHYTVNTATTIRILDDVESPPVVPNYAVSDVARTVRAVTDAGGRVTDAEPAPDGGGWARGVDDQGLPLLVYRPGGYHAHAAPTRAPSGELGLVFIRADAPKAAAFYGEVLGWTLTVSHPGSYYFDAVPGIGVFDEAAAFERPVEPSATPYFSVDALLPVLRRIEALGGTCRRARRRTWARTSPRCAPTIRARRSVSCPPRSTEASATAEPRSSAVGADRCTRFGRHAVA